MDVFGVVIFFTFVIACGLYSVGFFIPSWLVGADAAIGLWQKFLPPGYHPERDVAPSVLLRVTQALMCLALACHVTAFLSDLKWRCSSVSYTMSYPSKPIGFFTITSGILGASGIVVFAQDTPLYRSKSLMYGAGFILSCISCLIFICLGVFICCRKSPRRRRRESEPVIDDLAPQNTSDGSPDSVDTVTEQQPQPKPQPQRPPRPRSRSRSQTPQRTRPTPPPRPRPQAAASPAEPRAPIKPRRPAPNAPPPPYSDVRRTPERQL